MKLGQEVERTSSFVVPLLLPWVESPPYDAVTVPLPAADGVKLTEHDFEVADPAGRAQEPPPENEPASDDEKPTDPETA